MLGRKHSGKVSKKFIGKFYFWGITSTVIFMAWYDQKNFLVCIKFDKGGNSLPKHFERTVNFHSNLKISLLSWNQTNTKWGRKVFLQLGRICFRILLRQSENFSDFCKVLSQFAFRNMIVRYRYLNPKHVIQRALKLLSISHTCFFDTTKLYKPLPLFAVFLRLRSRPISALKQHVGS